MKLSSLTLTVLALLASPVLHASGSAVPLLGSSLDHVTVFAMTYATSGANSSVYGDLLSGDVATAGAHASIWGNLMSVGAATVGAHGRVSGTLFSDGVTTTGDTAWVGGDVRSGGAATIGANATVVGKVAAMGAITLSASSITHGSTSLSALPQLGQFSGGVGRESAQLSTAQEALRQLGSGTALATTMTTDTVLTAGVFSAANLSTTAGITLTLDGQNRANQSWVFNIDDYLVAGAGTKIVLINGASSDSIIWNSAGYTSLGANASFLGTLIAHDYISIGAGASVTGIADHCGGIYSATSYISTGDGARIGATGCLGGGSGFNLERGVAVLQTNLPAVPEPSGYAMLLIGLALLGLQRSKRERPWQKEPVPA
ncbi:MAG: ice-binding family protein [Sphingomonadaceae bacterium]